MARRAGGRQLHRAIGAAGGGADLEGMVAGAQEGRGARRHCLHVAGHAGVRDDVLVRGTGDGLAVGIAVDALDHIGLRSVVGAVMGTAGGAVDIRGGVGAAHVAVHAHPTHAGVGHRGAVHQGRCVDAPELVRVSRIVRLMARRARDHFIIRGVRAQHSGHPAGKPRPRVATAAVRAVGRIGWRNRLHRVVGDPPFRALGVARRLVMALAAIALGISHADGGARRIGSACSGGQDVLAARPVAVFALNIGQVGERRIIAHHVRPVAVGYDRWEMPIKTRHHVAKAAIGHVGDAVVTDRVTWQTPRVVKRANAQVAVDALGEHGRVQGLGPRGHFVGHDAPVVTHLACVEALIRPRRDRLGEVGGPFRGGCDRGRDRVLALDIGPEGLPARHLESLGVGRLIDGDIRPQRAVGQRRHRAGGHVGQRPGDADDVRLWDCNVNEGVQIDGLAQRDGGEAGGLLQVGQFVSALLGGHEGPDC